MMDEGHARWMFHREERSLYPIIYVSIISSRIFFFYLPYLSYLLTPKVFWVCFSDCICILRLVGVGCWGWSWV